MKRLVGLSIALFLFVTSCGGFDSDAQLKRQEDLRRQQGEVTRADYTEEQVQLAQTEYAIVTFRSPPAASYEGDVGELRRTKPESGMRFDDDSPAVKAYLRHLENEHADFRSFLRRQAPRAEIVEESFITLNGVAVKLNGASLDALARGPNVRAVDYSGLYRPTMSKSTELVGATHLWSTPGLTGAGVSVAVIDTGIDPSHPFFACKTFAAAKVYASGSAFDPANALFFGHGTHIAGNLGGCAGTAGPLGLELSGVAPEADLYDYNVFPGFGAGFVAFGGAALSHDIVAAIDDAVLDGMHVINMSLGGTVDGPHDFLGEASNAAVDAGVVVVTSAGNTGPDPYTVGSPAAAEKVLAVAATTNGHTIVLPLEVDYDGNGTIDDRFGAGEGDFDPFLEKPATEQRLVLASDYGDELACSALEPVPAGSVVLIERGDCFFATKVNNAADAGAFGVVVYNHNPLEGAMPMAGEAPIPAVSISYEDGTTLLAGFDEDFTTVSIDGGARLVEEASGDILVDFSSRGPGPFNGFIKPEIAAPGANVVSSTFDGGFAMGLGTSISSPHVAGAAALLLEGKPTLSVGQVKAALVNSASPLIDPKTSTDYAVHEVGNGRLDVRAAYELDFVVSPPTASFGYHNLGGRSNIRNVDLEVTALDGSATCTAVSDSGEVTVSPDSFSADDTATLEVALVDATSRSGDADGYLTVSCDGQSVRVPWASYRTSDVPF